MKVLNRIVVVVLLVAVAAGGYYWFHLRPQGPGAAPTTAGPGGPGAGPGGGAKPGGPGGGPPGGMAMPVEAVPVKVGVVARTVTAVGTLLSSESVVIRPEIAGRIAEIAFDEGTRVHKGHALVRLDDAVARATLAQAQASLVLSRADNQRAIELSRQGASSVRNRDEAAAKLAADEAAVALVRAQLDKYVLTAPFDGDIGLRKVSPGDVVQPGQELVNLEAIDTLKLDFRVPEAYLPTVAVGQKLEVAVDAVPGKGFAGTVYAIDPLVDLNGRSINIRARVDNAGRELRPGLFARVVLTLTVRPDAILVPEQALMPMGRDQFVYRVVDGKAAMTKVRIGERRNGEVEVVEGLSREDAVVTAGHMKIRDGVPVNVITKTASQGMGS